MQRDPLTGLDLASDPAQAYPSPGAKVARLSRSSAPPEGNLDLTAEDPSDDAVLNVDRATHRETSTLNIQVRFWKPQITFSYHVEGPLSWAAPLCAVVLLHSVGAAVIVPRLILPPPSEAGLQMMVSGVSGGAILIMGASILLYWLRKRA